MHVGRTLPTPRRRRYLAAAGALALVVGLRPLRRLEVTGPSMLPTLAPGDRLVVVRLPRCWPLRPGRLVALRHPAQGHLVVKRVVATGAGGVTVAGDNAAASTDSRAWGPVPRRSVVGPVVRRYAPPARAGRPR